MKKLMSLSRNLHRDIHVIIMLKFLVLINKKKQFFQVVLAKILWIINRDIPGMGTDVNYVCVRLTKSD